MFLLLAPLVCLKPKFCRWPENVEFLYLAGRQGSMFAKPGTRLAATRLHHVDRPYIRDITLLSVVNKRFTERWRPTFAGGRHTYSTHAD